MSRFSEISDTSETRTGEPRPERVDRRFQRFYEEHLPTTVRLARLLTSDPHVAEDLAQDAFVRVYRYAESGDRAIENPAALLRTTTVNLCRSWHRSQQRAALRMTRHGAVADSLTEWERELDDSLRRLPYDQRVVVVLRYWLPRAHLVGERHHVPRGVQRTRRGHRGRLRQPPPTRHRGRVGTAPPGDRRARGRPGARSAAVDRTDDHRTGADQCGAMISAVHPLTDRVDDGAVTQGRQKFNPA